MNPRIAVIGAGKFGEMHLRAFSQMQRDGRAELAGIADVDPDLVNKRSEQYGAPGYSDYRELLANEPLDAVSIATPDSLHREIALACLQAGKHVLVEKPLDTSTAGCRELISAAERYSRLLQVDFHKRSDPYHGALRDLVRRGLLGKIAYGYAYMEDRIEVPRDWFPRWAAQSSPAWFLGVHVYDLIRWITGAEVRSVTAAGTRGKLSGLGIDTWDSLQARLNLSTGASFTVDTSWILPEAHESVVNQGIRMVGTEGMMEVDTQDRGVRGCLREAVDGRPQPGPAMQTLNAGFFHEVADPRGGVRYAGYGIESIQRFVLDVAFLCGGGSLHALAGSYADGWDGFAATAVAAAVHASAGSGGAIVPVEEF